MKKTTRIGICLLLISLLFLPAVAEARHGNGGIWWGFGAGLITGWLFAPRAVVVPPPAVEVVPSPVYRAPAYVPAPAPPPVYSYSNNPPQPGDHAKCREWRLLERRYQDTWDSYAGKWRAVPVEKWGWVEVPCGN